MILRFVVLIGLGLLLVAGIAAAKNSKKEETAVAVAERWLSVVDSGKYADSWKEAAGYFKKTVQKEKWDQTMLSFRKPLGRLISRKVKSSIYMTSSPGVPDGKYVVTTFETVYEKQASTIETVTTMIDKDGKWRVSGYYIK